MMKLTALLTALAGAVFTLLAGCDARRIEKLEEGVATEADVRAQFGEPAAVLNEADGSRVFEYPRQPEGRTNYFITIGADGKMSALRQVLNARNFAKVQPGMDKAEVRRILGRPAKATPYALKKEEVWDWRFSDEASQPKQFSVTFDNDGKVLGQMVGEDPRETAGR
ncbi:small protein A (tmRNA-binding) [Burkholderiales bacterium JOSHI_001]|nr:small protein A (tmRNA-binding) [Burkholderiales bacterium JOSHI_001]